MQILNRLYQVDERLFLWLFKSLGHKKLSAFAHAVSRTGDGYLQVFVPILIYLIYGSEAKDYFNMVLAAFAVERSVYWVLKNTLKRRRPPQAIPAFQAMIKASDEFSFPSGHTSAAFLLAALTVSFAPAAAPLLFTWACLVGLSRVMLGVHFPADILAGAVLGSSIAALFQFVVFA